MQTRDVRDSVAQLKQALEKNGYSKGKILQFSSTTNQLLEFMRTNEILEYSMDAGLRFMGAHYGFKAEETLSYVNRGRILDLTMLPEFQLHGTYMIRHRNWNYHIPKSFQPATEGFLVHRRVLALEKWGSRPLPNLIETMTAGSHPTSRKPLHAGSIMYLGEI